MVNRQAMTELADFIEPLPDEALDMNVWLVSETGQCETAACVAGWAVVLHEARVSRTSVPSTGRYIYDNENLWRIPARAAPLLGLTGDFCLINNLFYGYRYRWSSEGQRYVNVDQVDFSKVRPRHVAAALRHVAETGQPYDWPVECGDAD